MDFESREVQTPMIMIERVVGFFIIYKMPGVDQIHSSQ